MTAISAESANSEPKDDPKAWIIQYKNDAAAAPRTRYSTQERTQYEVFRKLEGQTAAVSSSASHLNLERFGTGNERLSIRTERLRWMPAR